MAAGYILEKGGGRGWKERARHGVTKRAVGNIFDMFARDATNLKKFKGVRQGSKKGKRKVKGDRLLENKDSKGLAAKVIGCYFSFGKRSFGKKPEWKTIQKGLKTQSLRFLGIWYHLSK